MAITRVERVREFANRMLEARTSLQILFEARYQEKVCGNKAGIRNAMRIEGKSAFEVCERLIEFKNGALTQLEILAATLEIIEEDARR
jgi:hypothetical protein